MQKGDGPFKAGEYLTAAKLNQYLPRPVKVTGAGGIHSGPDGDVLSVDIPEEVYIKLTAKNGTSPIKYSWQELARNVNGTLWQNCTYNGTFSADYAIEQNNSDLSTTDGKVYLARRSETSGEMVFSAGGGGGNATFDIKGKDILLMLLGTYDEYKNCPDVPPDPPKHADDTLCEPAYAWAAYKICGYKFTKLFDARDYGTWAIELNGQSSSSWRRFHTAAWGWDTYTDGQPSGDEACAGVRFLKNDLAALSCLTCPPWVETTDCIKLTFTTPPRPCPPPGYCDFVCGNMFAMDYAGAWDKTFNITLCRSGCNFSFSGTNEEIPFNVNITFEEIPRGSPACDWGPSEYDPCDPCSGFTRWKFCLNFLPPYSAIEGCEDCGGLLYLTNEQMKDLIVNCVETPVPYVSCNGCIGTTPPYGHFDFILQDSVKLNCCSAEEEAACAAAGGGGPV